MIDLARPDDNEKFERSLDLGCSVGRFTFELASFSELAVGVDLNFNIVSEAARIHRTQTVAYARRKRGRWYEEVQIDYRPPQNVLFLVADCLDPPFRADSFDLVAGLNLIDNVKLPLVLIGQMDALLRQSGYLITGAPYEWRSEICEPQEWLESDELDSPEMARGIIEGKLFPQMGLNYEVVHEILDVPWILRHHDRYWSLFLLHLLKARKMS